MILGTAGHIDHGKSQLIRTLTGVETDRLQEEKRRGISIELGYAYAEWDGFRFGFIDVPGHEKLIHTMVAGASGMHGALLVVAVDDGVMPQTREHLAILSLLGVQELVVLFTKVDTVQHIYPDELDLEVRALCAELDLQVRTCIALDARHMADPGISALREHLTQWRLETSHVSDQTKLFRLPLDRVFTLAGQGTIVTGTIDSGQVQTEDMVEIWPLQHKVRVRQIHAQNLSAQMATHGQRCALNITGIEKDQVARGYTLLDAGGAVLSARFECEYHPIVPFDGQQAWQSVHLHIGTHHTIAHLIPLAPVAEDKQSTTGWLVQLVLEQPIAIRMGDRFILRNAQASQTIGGGVVVHPQGLTRKRKTPERVALLKAMAHWIETGEMKTWLTLSPLGLTGTDLQRYTGVALQYWQQLTELAQYEECKVIPFKNNFRWIAQSHWKALNERVLERIQWFHQKYPLEPGVSGERLRRICFPHWSDAEKELWNWLLEQGIQTKTWVQNKSWLALPNHSVQLEAADQSLADQIVQTVGAAGIQAIWLRDVAETIQYPEAEVRRIVHFLTRQGVLIQIVPDLLATAEQIFVWLALAQKVQETSGQFSVIAFKDVCQLGRKRAIQILEFLDRTGHTRRNKEKRLIRS